MVKNLFNFPGNPRMHISAIQTAAAKGSDGEASIQNSLQLALSLLRYICFFMK